MEQAEQGRFFLEWCEKNGININDLLEEDLGEKDSNNNDITSVFNSKKTGFLDRIKNIFKQVRTKKLPLPQEIRTKEEPKEGSQKHAEFVAKYAQNPDTAQALKNASTEINTVIEDKTH